ncbi:hypothetical protein [Parasitella parasitica]|uniref:Uncharacterized protein n=1 Tax=Parasitella parasitica TaxID=35722 RepID=A0A0B7MPM0_9FUNG|nr:hypothetical protein [Parasitella parasitica]
MGSAGDWDGRHRLESASRGPPLPLPHLESAYARDTESPIGEMPRGTADCSQLAQGHPSGIPFSNIWQSNLLFCWPALTSLLQTAPIRPTQRKSSGGSKVE